MKRVKIAGRWIGENQPTFVIAEIGVNHNGKIELAKELVKAAVRSGVDAVKFQTFSADKLVTQEAPKAAYQRRVGEATETQYSMLKKLELTKDELQELMKCARDLGAIFLSTPFDEQSADLLVRLGVPALKIGSGDLTTLPLLEHVAEKQMPTILSTGMSTLGEVEEAVQIFRDAGNEELILLHSTSCYPARIEDVNLRVIKTLQQAFQFPVGYSDHTLSTTVPIAAVALGAVIIEKHFTLDRTLPGPDQQASMEPSELKEIVTNIRVMEKALGSPIKKPVEAELGVRKTTRRSIVANRDIPSGTTIKREMISFKRPCVGLPPKFWSRVVGRKAKVDIKKDQPIGWKEI